MKIFYVSVGFMILVIIASIGNALLVERAFQVMTVIGVTDLAVYLYAKYTNK